MCPKHLKLYTFYIITILSLIFFIPAVVNAQYASVDISTIGVGARPMGMGKAYVALANDPSAMFLNPAGLGQFSSPRLQSMQTSLLGDIHYLTLGGTFPLGIGNFGTSLLKASVGGIPITELDENNRPRVSNEVTYTDSMWIASYGFPINGLMNRLFANKFPGKLYSGITGKYFQKGVPGIAEGKGFNIDVGLLYHLNNKWRFGLVQKNALFYTNSLGKIQWDTGAEDELVSNTTFGLAYFIDHKWSLQADYDFSFSGERKALLHLGTEYKLGQYASARLGYEQIHDSIGAATFGQLTMGLTLQVLGFSINYAYQPYYDYAASTTHFISFEYNFAPPKAPKFIIDPEDELTYEQEEQKPKGSGITSIYLDEVDINE